jgi:hypothetical protein
MRVNAARVWPACAAILYLLLLPAGRRKPGSFIEGSYSAVSEFGQTLPHRFGRTSEPR